MQHGFKVGDVVQHEFKYGWVGKVIGFDQSGSFATVTVEWGNDEAVGPYSQIGAAGLRIFSITTS